MRIIIHDLKSTEFQKLFPNLPNDTTVIAGDAEIHHCLGCFGCWTKTPGACVIRDQYGDMGEHFSKCRETLIISKCYYGGFSPFVKNVLDRSISYMHPNFEDRNGEMHHKRRYDNTAKLEAIFYGEDISEKEKKTARRLVKANAINMSWQVGEVSFVENLAELEGQSL